jgi:hypothetical protein
MVRTIRRVGSVSGAKGAVTRGTHTELSSDSAQARSPTMLRFEPGNLNRGPSVPDWKPKADGVWSSHHGHALR